MSAASKVPRGVQETPRDHVRVRMYRVGFGECFLLTFPRLGTPFHMLIDCGVFRGTKQTFARITEVARDVRAATGGRLEVLVVTHRHRDHLSGFIDARAIFDGIDVAQVWLGWPEDPGDREARRLEQNRSQGATSNEQAIAYVRRIGKLVRYWRGGDGPVGLSGVAGARVFFLGPPTTSADLGEAQAAIAAAESVTVCPFDETFRIGIEVARRDPIFAAYFGEAGSVEEGGGDAAEKVDWRQIGETSQDIPPRLRLGSPEAINDTSVVMAIELSVGRGDGKVLLFPGDAMTASWLSWHEHRWPAGASPGDPQTITCRKLLERTVLYKASQHGGRSGTPRRFGLEMMTSPDLVAMISVQEGIFRDVPSRDLVAALAVKAHGRIIRSDRDKVPGVTGPQREAFQRAYRATDLYLDYHVMIPRLSAAERAKSADNWSSANERRVYLVDKKLAGTIRPEEEAELRELEKLMDEYLSATAPTGSGLLAELRETVDTATSIPRE